jgi:hypothetical protein
MISKVFAATTDYHSLTDIGVINSIGKPLVDNGTGGATNISTLFNQAFYAMLAVAIALAIFMIIRGGYQYIMSSDNGGGKSEAKKRIQASFGGLLLALGAVLILQFINPEILNLKFNFPELTKPKITILGETLDGNKIGMGTDGKVYTVNKKGIVGDTNSVVKGDFSYVTSADIRPYLGQNYTDEHIQAFIDAGRQHGIDPRFLASISKFETTNGTSKAFTDGRNNAMGISNSVGPIGFSSVRESILAQANSLSKQGGYYSKATTIQQIGNIYAPAINPKTGKPYANDPNGTNWSWAGNVSSNYQEMTKK